jgi:hypothetical protein
MSVLFIHSHSGAPPAVYARAVAERRIVMVRESELGASDFDGVKGLLTTTHLDQIGLLDHLPEIERLLGRGGRWFFNGHVMRPFVPGLRNFVPLDKPRRADLALTRLAEHPIFAGIDQKSLEENRGVAGFYGRGHNPLPPGGLAVTGIGPRTLPIDWDWATPLGGRFFSHAGNDLVGMGGSAGHGPLLAERILHWLEGRLL